MKNLVETEKPAWTEDGLIAGAFARRVNVEVSSGTTITRGMILAGTNDIYSPASAEADAKKSLVIAAEDADSDATVVTAFSSGDFHADKVSAGDVDVAKFADALRVYNINLTYRQGVSSDE